MISSLFRTLLFLAVVLVVGVVGYNYYLGSEPEKQSSQEIIDQVTGLGKSVVDLLRSEKEKFSEGKYNDALDKIGDAFASLQEQAKSMIHGGQQWLSKIDELEEEKGQLEARLEALEKNAWNSTGDATGFAVGNDAATQFAEQLRAEIQKLANETELLARQMKDPPK